MHHFRWCLNVPFVIKYTTKVLQTVVGAEQMKRREFSSTWNVITASFCLRGHRGRSSAGRDSEDGTQSCVVKHLLTPGSPF